MENEADSSSGTGSSGSNTRPPVSQMSLYERQAVQALQALHRQPNAAAQYLQQMYAAQHQQLMLQQHLSTTQLQNLAAVHQVTLAANRVTPASSGETQSGGTSQSTVNLSTLPATQGVVRPHTASSPVTSVLLSPTGSTSLSPSQAKMYLQAQVVARTLTRTAPLTHQLILMPGGSVTAVQTDGSSSGAGGQCESEAQNLAVRGQPLSLSQPTPTPSPHPSTGPGQPLPSAKVGPTPHGEGDTSRGESEISGINLSRAVVTAGHTLISSASSYTQIQPHCLIHQQLQHQPLNLPPHRQAHLHLPQPHAQTLVVQPLTQAPSEAQKPSQAQAEAQKPSQAQAEAQKPSQAQAEAQKPCQALPEAQKTSQVLTEALKPCQGLIEARKPCQGLTEAPKPCQGLTEAAKPCQGLTEAPKPCQGLTEAQKPCQGLTEAQKPCQGLTEAQKPCQGLTEAQKPCQGLTEAQKPCQGLAEAQKPCQGLGEAQKPCQGLTDAQKACHGLTEAQKPCQGLTEAHKPNQASTEAQKQAQTLPEAQKQAPTDAQAQSEARGLPEAKACPPARAEVCPRQAQGRAPPARGQSSSGPSTPGAVLQSAASTQTPGSGLALAPGPQVSAGGPRLPLPLKSVVMGIKRKAEDQEDDAEGACSNLGPPELSPSLGAGQEVKQSIPGKAILHSGPPVLTSVSTLLVGRHGGEKPPRAIVKPHILTHVIEGFVIQEGAEPFPVEATSDQANCKQKPEDPPVLQPETPLSTHQPSSEPVQQAGSETEQEMLTCEFCGQLEQAEKFKRSKRFCSMACAKRYNVSCRKGVRRFTVERAGQFPKEATARLPRRSFRKESGDSARTGLHKRIIKVAEETSRPTEVLGFEEAPRSPTPGPRQLDRGPCGVGSGPPDMSVVSGGSPAMWSVQQVRDFIISLPGCQELADEFQLQEIDGQALLLLKEEHLMTTMNMKLGPALKICARINLLKEA